MTRVRLLVHDYSGHPFQLQLSRRLAAAGYDVHHQYCASYSTGRGDVHVGPDDPALLRIDGVSMAGQFARYDPVRRVRQEIGYGLQLGSTLRRTRPDAVVMCNIPLLANFIAAATARALGVPVIFWHQDVYSDAIGTTARRRLGPGFGGAVAWVADRLERWIARSSAHIVAIADNFREVHRRWGTPQSEVTVVPNWAPLDEMPQRTKGNAWTRARDLDRKETVVYSGTLGLKHDPTLLRDLAEGLLVRRPGATVVVISEGQGREFLEAERDRLSLHNLVLLDYQPYEDLPDVLAGADLFIALLEPDAGRYSVPSKILNYLCAGRPVVAVMPEDNAAAAMLRSAGAGTVIDASHRAGVLVEVERLLDDDDDRHARGASGRAYAERTFDVDNIVGTFEKIIQSTVDAREYQPV